MDLSRTLQISQDTFPGGAMQAWRDGSINMMTDADAVQGRPQADMAPSTRANSPRVTSIR
ncbi:MAG: hypothetical protein AAGH48_07205 [Pseudomonadota bacterium]